MSAAATPPLDDLAGWRYPRTRPSLPESYASRVERGCGHRGAERMAAGGDRGGMDDMTAVTLSEAKGHDPAWSPSLRSG